MEKDNMSDRKKEFLERYRDRCDIREPSVHCKYSDYGLSEAIEKPFLYMTGYDDVEFTVMVLKNNECVSYEVIEAQHLGNTVEYAVTRVMYSNVPIPISVHYQEQDCMTVKVEAPENHMVQILERRLS